MASSAETKTDDSFSMKMTCFGIRKKFANVTQVSTQELAEWMADGKAVTLLDARPEKEFIISRISGAERVDPDNLREGVTRAEEILSHTPVDQIAVLYCSVGYRSCLVADKLMQKWSEQESVSGKRPDVARPLCNLEGSIFKWANENRPVTDSEGAPTHLVHHYNSFWGKLLEASRRFVD